MKINRLNPVQKATCLKKSKVGKNFACLLVSSVPLSYQAFYGLKYYNL